MLRVVPARSVRGLLLAAAIVVLGGAAPAAAAPFKIAEGGLPHVAMDGAGTAYIAYIGNEANNSSLHLCRLPRGATACAVSTTIAAPGESNTRPFVVLRDGRVRVFSNRFGITDAGIYVFVSTDDGATFPSSGRVSDLTFSDAAVGPGNFISFATHAVSGGEYYQQASLDPPAPPGIPPSKAQLSTTHLYSGTVAMADATTPIVVSATAASQSQFRTYSGTGDINQADGTTWNAPVGLGYGYYHRFANGPSGLFLMSDSDGGPTAPLVVRRFAGGAFGAPVPLPNGAGEEPQADLAQDPAGRLHAVWPQIDGNGPHLLYAASDDGAAWTTGTLVAADTGFAGVRAALAADHVGVAAWDTGPAAAPREVHVVGLGPLPPVAPAPPAPPPPAPIVQQPVAPKPYAGAFKPVAVVDRGGTYTFTVPRGCVQPGQRFRVTLKWKRKKRKGNLYVKLTRSDFYLGTKRLRIDRKAPFTYTFTVVATQQRGSTITVRARAFIKVRRGKVPKKSIRARVKVCA